MSSYSFTKSFGTFFLQYKKSFVAFSQQLPRTKRAINKNSVALHKRL